MPSRSHSRALRLLGFSLIPVLGLVSTLIALPAVTTEFGAEGWSAIAVGQSVGATAAVLAELGWGLSGPQRVARVARSNARRIYALSVWTRLVAAGPAVAAAAIIAFLLPSAFREEAVVTAIATTCGGLSAIWLYMGLGRPWTALLVEAVPRVLSMGAVAVLLSNGFSLVVYPVVGLLLPSLLSAVLGGVTVGARPGDWMAFSPNRVLLAVRSQWAAFSGRALSSLYIGASVGLVGVASPGSVAAFAAADRVMRLGLTALTAVPNSMHRWLGTQPSRASRHHVSNVAIGINVAVGLVAGAVYVWVSPLMATVLFSGTVHIDLPIAFAGGTVVALTCASRATGGLALVAQGKVHVVAKSALWGAIFGVPSILLLSNAYGAVGAMSGAALAELVVLSIQVFALAKGRN